MKNVWIVACALLFVAVAGFAQTPAPPASAPLTSEALAMILGEPAPTGPCAPQQAQQEGALFVAKRPSIGLGKALCTATANCGGSTISCSSNVSASSCTAVDRNCSAGQRGHVICDGVRTDCPCPCGGTVQEQMCCQCDQTGDCFACCRCAGGSRCALQCA